MSETVIKVEGLGKLYRLGEIGTGTLSHDLNRWWARVRGKEDPFAKIGETNDRTTKGESEYVWALKDINFEVKEGEVLGIIGRNGAGKSTLLKILSKVTSPSAGSLKIKGRIASLLEVGTGFHPELTGRENIFLNGAILGMTKREIQSKFDEIVDFSGVERYIDTPVKRYSSGMYVRLAFAVAAFLEPEILIVDEVLAVGDAEFQRKCLGRMQDVSKNDGRTVLFVSHNMASIQNLCDECLLLKYGTVHSFGKTASIIKSYLNEEKKNHSFVSQKDKASQKLAIRSIAIANTESYNTDGNLHLEMSVFAKDKIAASVDVRVADALLQPCAFASIGTFDYAECIVFSKGINKLSVNLDIANLAVGDYFLSFDLTIPNIEYLDKEEHCIQFEILKNSGDINQRFLYQSWNFGSTYLTMSKNTNAV